MWDKVCAVLQKWDNMGYLPISVSVNVSRADIYNIDLADDLLRIVRKYGLTASRDTAGDHRECLHGKSQSDY